MSRRTPMLGRSSGFPKSPLVSLFLVRVLPLDFAAPRSGTLLLREFGYGIIAASTWGSLVFGGAAVTYMTEMPVPVHPRLLGVWLGYLLFTVGVLGWAIYRLIGASVHGAGDVGCRRCRRGLGRG